MKFIHLTDIHILPEGETTFGQDTSATLSRAIDDIIAHHSDAEFCVVTGDITHHGDLASFTRARAMLDRLPMPVHVLIGNHDERAPAAQAFDLPLTDGFLQQALPSSIGTLLLLDTKDDATHGGAYCRTRLNLILPH